MLHRDLRIGLVVDNPKRDLRGLCFVAREIVEDGFATVFIPMYNQKTDVPALELDAIVVNYARKNNKSLIENYVSLGIKVFVLDTEGGILSNDSVDAPDNWAKMFFQDEFASLISGYFFWGRSTYNSFSAFSGLSADGLFITGCPRYDQASKKWHRVLKAKYKNHILVNTNFSAINPLFNSSIKEERGAFISVGWPEYYVDELLESLRGALRRIIEDVIFVSRSCQIQLLW